MLHILTELVPLSIIIALNLHLCYRRPKLYDFLNDLNILTKLTCILLFAKYDLVQTYTFAEYTFNALYIFHLVLMHIQLDDVA